MSSINIDWQAIRPLNGKRSAGFEELCTQLARAERPSNSIFRRKGSPDAGVECFAILEDGREWGWQAKYFHELRDAQWSQLDESVSTALQKHPRLTKYYICIPYDRPDERRENRLSAMQRWENHVIKWQGWASNSGMDVKFIYWGSHELLEQLGRPENNAKINFWFDTRYFDSNWFHKRIGEALVSAGPRYTPEVNIGLPIASDIQAFGRTKWFFNQIKSYAIDIRKNYYRLGLKLTKQEEPELQSLFSELASRIEQILINFKEIEPTPVGNLPFSHLAREIETAKGVLNEIIRLLSEQSNSREGQQSHERKEPRKPFDEKPPYQEQLYWLSNIRSSFTRALDALMWGEKFASSQLMIIKGSAGTGKTHLLCDISARRTADDLPTVLLMGQRFTSPSEPWTQILQQLDLSDITAETFVGALESAAQASNCRAFLVIDAVNEGTGRQIWLDHLQPFLAQLERSQWIGVLLSVRSSYFDLVIPEEVFSKAVTIEHNGFAGHEYDATKNFFVHYGLELPSTPLLSSEFRNPLFLKTLCESLKASGQRHLPRGFHGITTLFNIYLDAINARLSKTLNINPRDRLVHHALNVFVKEIARQGNRWLNLKNASQIIDALLPGRGFRDSLFYGLVDEGLLIQEAMSRKDESHEEIVYISYDRLADQLMAKCLLDDHFDPENPLESFSGEGPLAFLTDGSQYVSSGLLGAFCIQIPERTGGKEFITLFPKVAEQWGIKDAFRQSLIWRKLSAFSDDLFQAIEIAIQNDDDLNEMLDVLLTVSTLPEHPLNADYLHGILRRDSMPDRDAWWSTYLSKVYGCSGAVDRIIDWAFSVDPDTFIESDTVDLSTTLIAWMFSTPNRYLRDRATKALVNLMTNRLDAALNLVERFVEVDDPYIAERVYAAAYGAAIRSCDLEGIEDLATRVYAIIFANDNPPAHILLRDYARGIIELAIEKKPDFQVIRSLIEPPYNSAWPKIPTEEEIKPFLPDWSRGSHDSGELDWARNRIGSSVLDDDFARYVIGTNSGFTHWLSLGLNEPAWKSPDSQLAKVIDDLSGEEKAAWDEFKSLHDQLVMSKWASAWIENEDDETEKDLEIEANALEAKCDIAYQSLQSTLSLEHAKGVEEWFLRKGDNAHRLPPLFDLRLVQRYILWRVFDLGWTTDRFGFFDRFLIESNRTAHKTERIGKKYQWIAYHEIMSLVADHFQYRDSIQDDDNISKYEGPWQDYLRDIDPSCVLTSTVGGNSLIEHTPAWWCNSRYEDWGDSDNHAAWIMDRSDIPNAEELLSIINPEDSSQWFNLQSVFCWRQANPADQESFDVDQRELWYICTGYLIHLNDAEDFLQWARSEDFWNHWMPGPPEVSRLFLGEHGWAPASRYFNDIYYGGAWLNPEKGCPAEVLPAAFEYIAESTISDCSIVDGFTIRLPAAEIIKNYRLRWSGKGAKYLDPSGAVVVFDPTVDADGPSALLMKKNLLDELRRDGKTICWTVIGEKHVLGAGHTPKRYPSLRLSGAYVVDDEKLTGFLNFMTDG